MLVKRERKSVANCSSGKLVSDITLVESYAASRFDAAKFESIMFKPAGAVFSADTGLIDSTVGIC